MSDPGRPTTEPALRAAARPFRLAALALSEPLASVELLLAEADSLPAVLHPVLGLVDVDLFGALPPGDGRAGVVAGTGGQAPGRTSASRSAGRPRPAITPPSAPLPGAGAPAEVALVVTNDQDAVPREVDAVATAGSLLDRLAEEALEALAPATGNAQGGPRRTRYGRTVVPGPTRTIPRAQTYAPAPERDTTAVTSPSAPDTLDPGGLAGAAAATAVGAARRGEPSPAATPPPEPHELEPSPRARLVAIEAGGETGASPPAATLGEAEPSGLVGATLLGRLVDSALSRPEPAPRELTAQSDAPGSPGARALEVLFSPPPSWTSEPESAAQEARAAPESPTRTVHPAALGAAATPLPHDLAWLVNEALVEQARRHGVDLS